MPQMRPTGNVQERSRAWVETSQTHMESVNLDTKEFCAQTAKRDLQGQEIMDVIFAQTSS